MGYSVVNKYVPGKIPAYRTFVCDFEDDISILPIDVAFGSEAFCVENGLTYILQTNGVWEEKTEGEGGGGSGSGLPEVTTEDNGKILGVVNGEWEAAEPNVPGYIGNLTGAPQLNVTTLPLTYTELKNKFAKDHFIFFTIDGQFVYYLLGGNTYVNMVNEGARFVGPQSPEPGTFGEDFGLLFLNFEADTNTDILTYTGSAYIYSS